MKTQNSTFETMEENVNSVSKLISDTASAMTEIYIKQFEYSYDIMNNFMKTGLNTGKDRPVINTDLARTNIEMMKKNFDDISELSRKSMTTFKAINETFNEQMSFLTKNSIKLWSDLLQTADKKVNVEEVKKKENRKVNVN